MLAIELTLYTTHCPQCTVLENMLKSKGFEYKVVDDMQEIRKLKIMSVPVLFRDGEKLTYQRAYQWLTEEAK